MANFNPANQAEILLRLHDGLSVGAKYEIGCEESQENQNGARTRIVKIGALLLSKFGLLAALNFQLFWMVTAYKMMVLKRKLSLAAYLSARKTYLQRKRRCLQARRVSLAFLTASCCLTLICSEVDVLILYLSFEIRETTNKILSAFIALISLKSFLLPSASHIVSCFSARAEIPFRLQEIFFRFSGPFATSTQINGQKAGRKKNHHISGE